MPVTLDAQMPTTLPEQSLNQPERNNIDLPAKQATADEIENGALAGRRNKSVPTEKKKLKATEIETADKVVESPAGKVVESIPSDAVPATVSESLARLNDVAAAFSHMHDQTGSIEIAIQSAVPRYDLNPAPVYPDIARRKGLEGRVLLKVMVSEDGSVDQVEIIHSSGFKALDRSALKAVRRWQFVPAMSAGVPVASGTQVPINFDLP